MSQTTQEAEQAPPTDGAASRILLQPYRLNDAIHLKNRVLMAPMTRSMAGPGLVATSAMADYYARRAEAGLIVTEATIIRPDSLGYPDTPGIYTDDQVEGWRQVTRRVHEAGGKIFLQIWHVGRVSHPYYLNGQQPIAPSAVALSGRVPRQAGLEYGTPRELRSEEIAALIEDYAQAAQRGIEAGFDGVEIHGANGYLIDQFLHHQTNLRKDEWGGSPLRMARFALEVTDAVIGRVGNQRTGLRLSPGAFFNLEPREGDAQVFTYLLNELESRRLAYLHSGIFDDSIRFEELGGRASEFLRRNYSGVLVGNGGYGLAEAADGLSASRFDLIAIGRPFIANPDLIKKIRSGKPTREYDGSMLTTLH